MPTINRLSSLLARPLQMERNGWARIASPNFRMERTQGAADFDFMFGSGEMDLDGLMADGTSEPVMRAGEWAFDL